MLPPHVGRLVRELEPIPRIIAIIYYREI